jgi:hypothetical protein
MKKQLCITLLAIVSLAVVMLNMSCGETQQTYVAADCSGDPPTKQKKIKDKIKDKIKNMRKLDYQYANNKFNFEPVIEANGEATLYLWGSIFTSANDLEEVAETYEDVFKKGCVSKVVFTSPPAMSASAARLDFAVCEAPNQICPDGTCREECVR